MPSNNNIYKMSNAGGMSTITRYVDMLAGNAVWDPFEPAAAYESIMAVTLSGSTSSVTLTSIPSAYRHLQLRVFARSAQAASSDALYLRFNGDFTNNYSRHSLSGNGSAVSADAFFPENVVFAGTIAAASSTSNVFGSYVIDVLDYTDTNKNKVLRSLGGYDANGSGVVDFRSSNWNSTAAITSITLANYTAGANFAAGTQFALYGIKG
jgi:hypothetical protein